jgi:hypothetical protein
VEAGMSFDEKTALYKELAEAAACSARSGQTPR